METTGPAHSGSKTYVIDTGDWKGWFGSEGDNFNDHAGPFYHRLVEGGSPVCAMRVGPKHINGGGMMHGGAIMTFADYCLYVFAASLGNRAAVTVTLHGDFLGAVPQGALLECTGEVTKRTRSMTFLRGLMKTDDNPVFSFSGVLKTVGR